MFLRQLPTLSVVIPTLNEACNIGTLLKALGQQDYPGAWEVIVVDGGSEDDTLKLARQVPLVRVLNSARGVSRQRNLGGQAAVGELLIFLDADDRPNSQFLSKVAASYRRLPFAVACPWFVTRDSGWLVSGIYQAFNIGFWLGQSTLRMGSGVCLICPRDSFLSVGGFDENLSLGEDIHLIRKLCPRRGLHRHLLVPLETSGRRFRHEGVWKLWAFYGRITPLLLLGLWKPLQRHTYPAAPYTQSSKEE